MTAPLEELLRETLDRLSRQEARTAALEAALLDTPPPTVRASETVFAPRSKRPPTARVGPRPVLPPPVAVSALAVLASLDDVVWSISPDGQLVFFAAGAVERIYGLTAHELQDTRGRWLDALPPDDRDRLREALAHLPDADTFRLEHRIETATGRRWAVTRGTLVRDRDGRPLRIDGATTDVTRQSQTRAGVLEILEGAGASSGSEFLSRLTRHLCAACGCRAAVIVESLPGAVDEARAAVAWVDGRSAEPFALPADRGLIRDLFSGGRALVPADARERYPADPLLLHLRADALVAEPLLDSAGRVIGFVALADDRPFAADFDGRVLLMALAGRAAVELVRAKDEADCAELRVRLVEAEQRAREAEAVLRGAVNLATAGRVAAGMAHDFHNLLGVIAGNADLLREALPAGDPQRETAETIARTAQTVATISRKVLAVGRPAAPQFVPLDAAAALRALDPILRRLVRKPVSLDFDLAPDLPPVRADPTEFDRVVLNLVLNARDASAAGGGITVRAAAAARPTGRFVALTVADTGCGMPAEVRKRMFELFFTTKGDRGTGLGLATVRDAVTAAGGYVEVESEVGWGTQVRVYWPALEG